MLGLAAAFMTAIYMTRMMLYTFHGPNRTGEKRARASARSAVDHDRPARRARRADASFGGWFNLPEFASSVGPVGALEHWLEPVVGEATLRVIGGAAPRCRTALEYGARSASRSLIALAGIALAWTRLKPAALVPEERSRRRKQGFEKVLVEQVLRRRDRTTRRSSSRSSACRANVLWRGIDVGLIDGLVVTDGARALARFVGWIGSQLQSGQLGTYAWVLVVGVLAVLGAFSFGKSLQPNS